MSRSLGGVTLPDQIEWVDKDTSSGVLQTVKQTLSGRPVLYISSSENKDITLKADINVSWFTEEQKNAVLALAQQIGGVFIFIWDNVQESVAFRHNDAPAVEFTPIHPHATIYTGIIKLMRV